MKIVQINAWHFKFLDELVNFLRAEKPNIINLQEVSTGRFNYCSPNIVEPFEYLKKELDYEGYFVPYTGLKSSDDKISYSGNGFLTDLEMVDYGCFFEKTLPEYTEYNEEHPLIQTILHDQKEDYYTVFEESKNFVWGVLKYKDKYIRNVTSHFTVSYLCTETMQMIQQTRSLLSFLKNTKSLPTIFTGDLNIHPDSASIKMLTEELVLVNKNNSNTLNPNVHGVFKRLPEGLNVDYIFQKGFEVSKWSVPNISVSDHLPIIAELEIG